MEKKTTCHNTFALLELTVISHCVKRRIIVLWFLLLQTEIKIINGVTNYWIQGYKHELPHYGIFNKSPLWYVADHFTIQCTSLEITQPHTIKRGQVWAAVLYHNLTFDHNILRENITESSVQSCAAVLFSTPSLLSFIMLFNYSWEWSEQMSLVLLTLLHITSSGILIVWGQLVFPWAALPTSARASSAAVKCFLISNQVFQVWRRKQEDNIKHCIRLQVVWFCCGRVLGGGWVEMDKQTHCFHHYSHLRTVRLMRL